MSSPLSDIHLSYYKGRPVTVTGGAGTIGSVLVNQLVQHHAQVTVLDNLSGGGVDNLAQSAQHINLVLGSTSSEQKCATALKGSTHLFHLAPSTLEQTQLLLTQALQSSITHIITIPKTLDLAPYEALYHHAAQKYGVTAALLPIVDTQTAHKDITTALLHAGLCTPLRGHTIPLYSSDQQHLDPTHKLQRLLAYRPATKTEEKPGL